MAEIYLKSKWKSTCNKRSNGEGKRIRQVRNFMKTLKWNNEFWKYSQKKERYLLYTQKKNRFPQTNQKWSWYNKLWGKLLTGNTLLNLQCPATELDFEHKGSHKTCVVLILTKLWKSVSRKVIHAYTVYCFVICLEKCDISELDGCSPVPCVSHIYLGKGRKYAQGTWNLPSITGISRKAKNFRN